MGFRGINSDGQSLIPFRERAREEAALSTSDIKGELREKEMRESLT